LSINYNIVSISLFHIPLRFDSILFFDTEFPGVVARPIGNFRTSPDYHYQTLRCNVDLLKIIQLGITFADEQGNLPKGVCTWQFNFRFNLAYEIFYFYVFCEF